MPTKIRHNLACKQPKLGHNLVRKRHKIGSANDQVGTFTRERPKFGHNPACEQNEVWAQCLWVIDENMGTNLQAVYKHFYIGRLKTQQQLHFVNGGKKKNYNFCFFIIRAGRL